jgi:large subunit ribosomal protein L29
MKQADIAQLSVSDIREKIQEEASALTKLKLNHAVSPAENPLRIRSTRRTIARLRTELRKRETAEQSK